MNSQGIKLVCESDCGLRKVGEGGYHKLKSLIGECLENEFIAWFFLTRQFLGSEVNKCVNSRPMNTFDG